MGGAPGGGTCFVVILPVVFVGATEARGNPPRRGSFDRTTKIERTRCSNDKRHQYRRRKGRLNIAICVSRVSTCFGDIIYDVFHRVLLTSLSINSRYASQWQSKESAVGVFAHRIHLPRHHHWRQKLTGVGPNPRTAITILILSTNVRLLSHFHVRF